MTDFPSSPVRRRMTLMTLAVIVAFLVSACFPQVGHPGGAPQPGHGGGKGGGTSLPQPLPPGSVGASDAGFSPGHIILWGSDAQLAADLDSMAATGASWVRVDFDWPSIQPSGPNSYNWSNIDRVVGAAHERGLSVLALPTYTPAWARPGGTSDKHPPTNPDHFATFVRKAVERYAPLGITAWEIWNEPNIDPFWQPKPDPARYTTLLKKSAAQIRAVDPGATIVSGGLAPSWDESDGSGVSPRTFLRKIYDNGGRDSFDAMGLHPYSFPYHPLEPGVWNTFGTAPDTYQVMVDHGDAEKKIWATEIGFPTGNHSQAVSESMQAQMISAAFSAWESWGFGGPVFWYSHRDHGTNLNDREQNFGLVHFDGSPKPAYAAFAAAVAD